MLRLNIQAFFLTVLMLIFASTAQAHSLELSDFARYSSGLIVRSNQEYAIQYCASSGARLPSARELAEYSMSLGAKGISEIADGKPDDSYYLISSINADGTLDRFYFSKVGFQLPERFEGENGVWSSSIFVGRADLAYFLFGGTGGVSTYYRYVRFMAIRCVLDQINLGKRFNEKE